MRSWNVHDFGQRLVAWYDEATWPSAMHVFDVGIASAGAIRKLRDGVAATESAAHPTARTATLADALASRRAVALRHNLEDAEVIRIAREHRCDARAPSLAVVLCAVLSVAARIGRGEDVEASWTARASTSSCVDAAERYELDARILPTATPTGSGYVVDCLARRGRAAGK
jgi:hypothetical protein